MVDSLEKRKHERYEEQGDIIYTILGFNNYSNAKMENCSMGGMFFNSDYKIDAGSEICIKMQNYISIFNAKVVRCYQVADIPKKKFGIAIQYVEESGE